MKSVRNILSPSGDCILVVFRVEESGCHIPFTPLGDLPLDRGHSSTIEKFGKII